MDSTLPTEPIATPSDRTMSRSSVAVAGVIAVIAIATAVGTVAAVRGWNTGPWAETLLLIGTVIVIASAGMIVVAIAISTSLRVAAFVFAPEEPRGLIRIRTIMEQHQAELQATEKEIVDPPTGH
jgi:hypothetical protein